MALRRITDGVFDVLLRLAECCAAFFLRLLLFLLFFTSFILKGESFGLHSDSDAIYAASASFIHNLIHSSVRLFFTLTYTFAHSQSNSHYISGDTCSLAGWLDWRRESIARFTPPFKL